MSKNFGNTSKKMTVTYLEEKTLLSVMYQRSRLQTHNDVVKNDASQTMSNDANFAPLIRKVRIAGAEHGIQSVQFFAQPALHFAAIQWTRVVHDIHCGSIEHLSEALQRVGCDRVHELTVQLQITAPFDWEELGAVVRIVNKIFLFQPRHTIA